MIDRREAATAMSKVIAYQNVNKPLSAAAWFVVLARVLGFHYMIKAEYLELETQR